ncbi:MAG TPA: hypothetical protein VFH31_02235 [Pyrinomonadaceae bacterium]|nr:hypothetical protein [Pyrinomonadaceae bacterium]
MKRRYRIVVVLVLIAGFLGITLFEGQQASNMVTSAEDESTPVRDALNEIGAKYGYFFTVEESFHEGGQTNRIESQKIERLTRGSGLEQELDELVRLVPEVIYKIDEEENPKIIHLIDAKLAKTKGYALDDRIKNIDFSGTVFELVAAIAKQGIRVSSQGMMSVQDLSSTDLKTQVVVKGDGLSVRKALTDFIPLGARSNRILWIARTKMDPDATSYVRFPLGSIP